MGIDEAGAEAETVRHPARKRSSLRIVLAIVVVVVLLYAFVIVLYSQSGRVSSLVDVKPPRAGGVVVLLTPQEVDAAGEAITMQLELDPSEELLSADSLTLAEDLTVIVSPVSGSQTIDFPLGDIPATHGITVLTPGAVENWPIDTYRQPKFIVQAYITRDGVSEPIDTLVFATGFLPGWSLAADNPPTTPYIALQASRSWSTLAFGILLLGLMVGIAGLVLYVTISVYIGRRKVEATFMSWIGAMLFATIPLRSFLPGSPPIGSWIDYLVVLWVFVALVSGLAIYVAAWTRWGRRPEHPEHPKQPEHPKHPEQQHPADPLDPRRAQSLDTPQ